MLDEIRGYGGRFCKRKGASMHKVAWNRFQGHTGRSKTPDYGVETGTQECKD